MLGAVSCISGELTGGEALPVIADIPDCTQTGPSCATWTYLYACYFGTNSPHTGGCSAQGTSCHAAGTSYGAGESGFICGSSSDMCWHGITSATIGFAVPVQLKDGGAATDTNLLIALHSKSTEPVGTTANNMPLKSLDILSESAYLFTPADLTCINDWVKAGAPEN